MTTDPFTLACSFCGRTQHEVAKLVAGPGVFICDTCVGLAADIVATSTEPATPLAERPTEDLRPILEGLEAAQHRNGEALDRWRAALSDR